MNYLDTIKNMVSNKERRVQNLVLLVILLVVVLIACNYIFSGKKEEQTSPQSNRTNTEGNIIDNENNKTANTGEKLQSDLEGKLGIILSQISGISDVSVVLTYSQDTTKKPVYNTKEEQNGEKKTTEKSVAYNEASGTKTAIIETIEMPKVEGAIVVAKGANTVDIRSKIASAISTVTALPVYKVQVFEKQG